MASRGKKSPFCIICKNSALNCEKYSFFHKNERAFVKSALNMLHTWKIEKKIESKFSLKI